MSHVPRLPLACSRRVLPRGVRAGGGGSEPGERSPRVSASRTRSRTAAGDAPDYWKGNLHTHSLWSDGDDFPEMIADWYKNHGYQFLAPDRSQRPRGRRAVGRRRTTNATRKTAVAKYVERVRDCAGSSSARRESKKQVRLKPLAEFRSLLEEPGKFLLIPAEEITHVYAKRPDPHERHQPARRDQAARRQGRVSRRSPSTSGRSPSSARRPAGVMLAFLNHPNFGWGVQAEDMLSPRNCSYFEVFNGHPERPQLRRRHARIDANGSGTSCWRCGSASTSCPSSTAWRPTTPTATTSIGVGKVNPGRGWVMVKSRFLTAEGIVKGIEAGDFYASTGVLFNEIARDGNALKLSIRTEPGVTYKTQFIATMKGTPLDAKPLIDKDGKELPVTMDYSH